MVDNVIKNYLTGLDIRNTPEEPNRQEMLRRLHEDYGYPKELMEIEFGVKKSPSDTRRTVPADIAVFDSYEDKQQRKPKIFVETKKNDYKLGKEQLQDYMAFEQHVTYGIWYNGSQEDGQSIAFFKKSFSSTGEINIDETLDVPKYKFSKIEEEIKRSHLKSTKNLKGIFKTLRGYMAVLGDGRAGLFVEDSLDEIHWGKNTAAKIQQKKFDIILTNPPFGKDVKVAEKTKKNFVFGNSIELAFIEKSLEHLKDGGVLGIILPETIFHAPSLNKQKVRRELFFNHNITHIIDLPHDTFRPYNNAKTDIIFLEKNKLQQENITVIKVNEIGHDHLGKEKFKLDTKYQFTNEVADDIPDIIRELSEKVTDSNFIKTIKAEEVIKRDLLVARPYFSIKSEDDHKVTLGDLVDSKVLKAFDGHGSPAGYLKGLGEYPYIRVKDIVNLEISHNRLDDIPEFEYKRLYSSKKKLQEKDLVMVRRGSYRIGDVGILYKKDINSILTREILVLRVNNNNANITPFNLLAILNSKEVRSQLENLILMDTTLPNIGDRWRLIKIDISNKNYLNKLTESGQSMYKKRDEFWQEYANLFGERG